MPGSRSSFSTNSITGIQQNFGNVSRAPAAPGHLNYNSNGSSGPGMHMHNQSFHGGNTSQHTATFHGGVGRDTNNTQTSNPANGFFDLNNLAYNVANEYLRPNNGLQLPNAIGGTFDQHHSGAPLVPNNFYRPPSVNAHEYAANRVP
jgi:hypothetical protein